jgi:trimeric autotransporter adhesin
LGKLSSSPPQVLSNGTTEDLTNQATWASSDTTWATINTTGLATAVSAGAVTISATFDGITGSTGLIINNAATVSSVSISWGAAGTVALQTASDGLRLLPVGRTTDLPWSDINSIAVTLSSSASLTSGDVSVSSADGINYGAVTISGSGTNYVITLAQPISTADRVTFTIANPSIATYSANDGCRIGSRRGHKSDNGNDEDRVDSHSGHTPGNANRDDLDGNWCRP